MGSEMCIRDRARRPAPGCRSCSADQRPGVLLPAARREYRSAEPVIPLLCRPACKAAALPEGASDAVAWDSLILSHRRSCVVIGAVLSPAMSSSVSFRITRTAEDLAQTITALTQRLVKLEQRQEALELQVRQQLQSVHEVPDEELATLDGIEQLLSETRQLLQSAETLDSPVALDSSDLRAAAHDHTDHDMAA